MTFIPTIHLVLLVAVTWRLANLVANEDGPALIFRKLRRQFEKWDKQYRWFRKGHWKTGIACEYCNSIWFGILLTIGYRLLNPIDLTTTLLLPLALSTGAIVIKHVVFLLKSADHRLDQLNQDHDKPEPIKAEVQKQRIEQPALLGGWTKGENK